MPVPPVGAVLAPGTAAPTPAADPWSLPAGEVLSRLGSDGERGLPAAEVALRRDRYGPNALRARASAGLAVLVLAQLRDTMVLVLLGAAVLTVVVGDLRDTAVIALVVALNTVLGVSQQHRAEQAVAALARLAAPAAHVVRDGLAGPVPSELLVPGDLLRLEAGDVVPADARLLLAAGVEADEAPLTGESAPVAKRVAPCEEPAPPVALRHCMLHAGTVLTAGRAEAVVTATGMGTQVGRVAQLLDAQTAPATPLQVRLAVLGRQIAAVAVGTCLLVLVMGLLRGEPVERMLLTAVSLAVAAVPESLPAVVALSLALSARRMAARQAIVRSLPAVEALGSVTVVASDKTGTLTEGVMVARQLWTPGGSLDLAGEGYDPAPQELGDVAGFRDLLQALALCNDARLVAPAGDGARWTVVGDPTEAALLVAAGRAGLDPAAPGRRWVRVAEQPFAPERGRMTTLHRDVEDTDGPGRVLVVLKGAPEVVLGTAGLLAPGQEAAVRAAEQATAELSGKGFRVLAAATGRRDEVPEDVLLAERDLHLLGLVALQDPPRASAARSVAECRTAGIIPIMITGDAPRTAAAIATAVGILGPGDRVVTGPEVADVLARGQVEQVRVYARTAPEQKLDIVEAWRRAGHVVAMTGDGVNDAPALRRADVGVAMGRSGTEVARQAADVVLADDHFSTVVEAVREGRRVYDNIRRFLLYALTGGLAELLLMLLGPAVGLALPLLPAQILWVNLLTHGMPGVALGAEEAEPGVMRRPPHRPGSGVLGEGLWQRVLAQGALVGLATLALGVWARSDGRPWQSMVFVALTTQQLLLALVLRSATRPAWHLRGNPLLLAAVVLDAGLLLLAVWWHPLVTLLATTALGGADLRVALLAALPVPLLVELAKRRPEGRRRSVEERPFTSRRSGAAVQR